MSSTSNTTTSTPSLPAVSDRVTSASGSSSSPNVRRYIPAPFINEPVGIDTFLPSRMVETEKQYCIDANMSSALTSETISESDFSKALYEQLVASGVNIPVSLSEGKGEVEGEGEYRETSLSNILCTWCESIKKGKFSKTENTLHGLTVTNSSIPDFVVYRGEMIHFGEVKNNRKYFVEEALSQCSLYLVALLYFIRVQMANPVDSVFGFYVCGCKCSTLKGRYLVGLVKLSAPAVLGESIVAYNCVSTYPTSDTGGIQLLVNFLKNVQTDKISATRFTQHDTPALLVLPKTLWNHPCLINNGTLSIVFCGTASDVISLLSEFAKHTGDRHWRLFNADVVKVLTPPDNERKFYLKVQTKVSTLRESPASALIGIFDGLSPRYIQMYCDVLPYGNKTMGVFFMEDCGKRVDEQVFQKITFSQFCMMFTKFYDETIELCCTLFHGDVLPHNIIVTEKDELMLIDLDEGTVNSQASNRVIDNASSAEYPHLRYPNFLRTWRNRELYTKVQLLASFFYLVVMVRKVEDNNAMTQEEKNAMSKLKILQDVAPELNTFLQQNSEQLPSTFNSTRGVEYIPLKQATDTLESLLDLFK